LNAGSYGQKQSAVAIGSNAGYTGQQQSAVAIGLNAGSNSQGTNAVAIGNNAGSYNQPTNSIVINASGIELSPSSTSSNACFIKPIRATNGNSYSNNAFYVLSYNPFTGEIAHAIP
jgi:hypothetical protein